MRCALSSWAAVTRYCDDGRLEVDNNAGKCAIRKVTRQGG